MKIGGAAGAFLFLVAVSAIRMGDKPLFVTPNQAEAMSKATKALVTERLKAGKKEYVPPKR